MQDTCFKACKNYKKKEKCPDFIITDWEDEKGQKKQFQDCVPRRTLTLMLEYNNRLQGFQKASEQQRNAVDKILNIVTNFIQHAQQKILIGKTPGLSRLDKSKM